jgi:hypothetical protein
MEPQAVLEPGAAQAWTLIETRVAGVRQKNRAKFLGTGLCAALAVFVAAFLGFSAADILFKLSVSSRVLALLSTLIAIGVTVFWSIIRPWTRLGGAVQVARNVEGVYPQLDEQLSTAVEYGLNPQLSERTSSPALVGALMRQTAERAEPLDFARTIHWKPLAIAALLAFLLAAGVAGYASVEGRLFKITLSRFLKPMASLPVPTLTEIVSVSPGNDEVPLEHSVPVAVQVTGRKPATATLSVFVGGEQDGGSAGVPAGHWEDRVMDVDPADGRYKATLRRLLDTTRYRVMAGDTESPEYKIDVYKPPEISDFVLRLEYPSYTGRGIETLAPGVGDVRVLRGTTVHVELQANTPLASAKASFKSGRAAVAGTLEGAEKRKAEVAFKVDKDDEYQIQIANPRGKTGSGLLYTIKALKDRPPKVSIKKPEKDLMVHREQTVEIQIAADDDIGVAEMGIYHSLDLDETKTMVRRLDPPAVRAEGKLVWELGHLGLKGGEVIAYYAYALDNDTLSGPKMAKSDIHFLTIYDEQEYDQQKNPDSKKPPTPPAVKQLDKLVDAQKKLLKETFAQAQLREAAKPQPITDAEKNAASKTGDAQKKLRGQVEEMIEKVKQELEQAEENPNQPADDPNGPKPAQGTGMGSKELKHLEAATEKMTSAEGKLKVPDTAQAVRPETESLRHLSETRRLLLSDKDGDPRFKMAMDKQSKKKKQQEQSQQQQDEQQAKQEMTELPKMMDREKQLERELAELNERKKKNPPPEGQQTEEQKREQEEQRKLQREKQQELEKLAKEAEERARKLERLAARNPNFQNAADKMRQAQEKLEKAAEEARKQAEQNSKEAQEQTRQAQNDTKDAHRSLRNELERQIRNELNNLQKDAQELAQRQQDLAEQTKQAQNQDQQQNQPQQGKPEKGQPQQGKPQQGQPQQGQPQQGQPQQGQPQQGQPQQGQPQQGKPQQGRPSSQQQMKGMAGQEREIRNDLKDLADRLEKMAGKAGENDLAGTPEVKQAQQQAGESGAANQTTQKAQDALQSGKPEDAQRETAKAAKALEQIASTLREASQKTTAADMKDLAKALKKLQGLAKEQSDLNREIAQKVAQAVQPAGAPSLAEREEKVGQGARELADAAEKMEVLRQQGKQGVTKERLDDAAKSAATASQALKAQDTPAAKAPAENTEKALNQALTEMERAAGKTLEDKARDAKNLAKAARENQDKASSAAKDIEQKPNDAALDQASAAKRDEAASKEFQASRDAQRLDHALDGLQQMAQEANPAAADAAKQAREMTAQAQLPKAMEDLARGIEKIGDQNRDRKGADPKLTPKDASQKGEQLGQVVKDVEKQLDAFMAEATGSPLDRLRQMEQAAREAAKRAQELAQAEQNRDPKGAEKKPDSKPDPNAKPDPNSKQPGQKPGEGKPDPNAKSDPNAKTDPKDKPDGKEAPQGTPEQRAEALKKLENDLKRLQPKLERLEPNAPEIVKMREAVAAAEAAKEPQPKADPNAAPAPGGQKSGGPALDRTGKLMDEIVGGLVTRIERILRAREIRPDEDEDAPKEYRTLVDRYYRALSEDVEEDKK